MKTGSKHAQGDLRQSPLNKLSNLIKLQDSTQSGGFPFICGESHENTYLSICCARSLYCFESRCSTAKRHLRHTQRPSSRCTGRRSEWRHGDGYAPRDESPTYNHERRGREISIPLPAHRRLRSEV